MKTATNTARGCAPWLHFAAASLLGVALTIGCDSSRVDPVGGETHFLTACDPNGASDACGSQLSCVCNVCTAACADESACPDVPGVACIVADPKCGTGAPAQICDVTCSSDADCAPLSGVHVCENGVCRAGTSSALESDGLGCAPGSISAGRMLVIGDGMFAGTNKVATALGTLAQDAGLLPSGEQLRDESSNVRDTLVYDGEEITGQYLSGNRDGAVKLVVMTGGAVDAIAGSCQEVNAQCPVFLASAVAAADLFEQMAADGVEQVVYTYYPEPSDAGQKQRLDVLRSLLQPVCDQSRVPCYFLDLQPVFQGHIAEYVGDGLTVQGAKAIAEAIWKVTSSCLAP